MPERWGKVLGGKPVALNELSEAARELLSNSGNLKVWLFEGEMGSGKTTLIKAICKELGVRDDTSSPTFAFVNQYYSGNGSSVYHFDFYRLEKESEAYDMGVEEYFESGSFCFVEWPDKIPTFYPLHFFKVRISIDTPSTRKIEYTLI